jgi:carbamoyltransferase
MYILGIAYGIDSSAAILKEGKVIAASAQERFDRQKHSCNFPMEAINFCLKEAGILLNEVDKIAFFWNPAIGLEGLNVRMSSRWRNHAEYLYNLPNYLLSALQNKSVEDTQQVFGGTDGGDNVHIHYINHHKAHAASAYFVSPFNEAAILTVDGYGEKACVLMGDGKGNKINVIREIDFPNSLGSIYAAFTQYLGFQANSGEGKVMGLAAFGDPDKYYKKFSEIIKFEKDGNISIDLNYFRYYMHSKYRYSDNLVAEFGSPRQSHEPIQKRHKDIAAGLQKILEDAIVFLCNDLYKRTKCKNLCFAGGVALNTVVNSKILKETPFENIFIQPNAGDGGTSLGAALYLYYHVLGNTNIDRMPHSDYLGPVWEADAIKSLLDEAGLIYEYHENIAKVCAELISEGNILGWFQGRMEFGPRALGNRSILADPRNPDMKNLINARVKKRESFRPYAPAVLYEHYQEYFSGTAESPYMLLVSDVKPGKQDIIPAVTHEDGTARVQTVRKESNPLFWELISEFKNITGIPVVLNTSFNLAGEPIVCSLEDALKCFYVSGMDYLAAGNYLVKKK